jgi:competence protein ComEA
MKNQKIPLTIIITVLFAGIIFGYLIGQRTSGETVFVAVPDEMMTLPTETEETISEICFPIDLNKASKEELMALPGIGEKMTFRIMAYRRERKQFSTVEDLLNVQGMTDKMLDKIRDLVYIGG